MVKALEEKSEQRPKLLKPSGQTFAVFWPVVGLLALFSWKSEIWVLVLGAGFFIGYIWAYLRIFWQLEQVFGKDSADKIWVLFRGH